MPKSRILAASLLAALLLLIAPAFLPHQSIALGQETQAPQGSATSVPSVGSGHQEHRDREGRLLVKEEEGEVDPNVAFRHTWLVVWISKKTGLTIDQTFWLCVALNFIVIAIVVKIFFTRVISLPDAFRNRKNAIQRGLEEARKASEEAQKRLADVEARLSRLDAEIEQMTQEAESSARHEEERVLAAAEEERKRIVESAEQEIARAASAARRELKTYAVELSIGLAEKRIRIAESADQKLVREFAAQLGDDN